MSRTIAIAAEVARRRWPSIVAEKIAKLGEAERVQLSKHLDQMDAEVHRKLVQLQSPIFSNDGGKFNRSAAGMKMAFDSDVRSIRGLSIEAKVDMIIQTVKEQGIRSLEKETLVQTVRSIKGSRANRISGTWLLFALLVLPGSAAEPTLVPEVDSRGMEPVKEEGGEQ